MNGFHSSANCRQRTESLGEVYLLLEIRNKKISILVMSVILLSSMLLPFALSVEGAQGKEEKQSLSQELNSQTAQINDKIITLNTEKSVSSAAKGAPRGFYAKWEMDVGGMRGCSSLCWDYYYFINDKQVATVFPDGGLDALNCSKDKCLTYQLKGNKLVLSNGKTYSFKVNSANELEIDGDKYTKYSPSSGLKLQGKYESFSYTSTPLGSGLASSITYTFNKDGTFIDNSFTGFTTDGSSTGDNSGVSTSAGSQSKATGTYAIVNYTISFKYKDGTAKKHLFFLPEQPSTKMLRIGGRDFLIADGKSGTKPQPPEQPFADFLTTKKIANKQVLFTFKPNKSDQLKNIKITLDGYQWAKLTIEPAHINSFKGFGDKGIVALTAKYRIHNESAETVNVNSLYATLELPGSKASVKASNGLTPKIKDELKPGESVETMSVFLVPAEHFEKNKDFELGFGPLLNLKGKDVFQEEWIGFYIWKDL